MLESKDNIFETRGPAVDEVIVDDVECGYYNCNVLIYDIAGNVKIENLETRTLLHKWKISKAVIFFKDITWNLVGVRNIRLKKERVDYLRLDGCSSMLDVRDKVRKMLPGTILALGTEVGEDNLKVGDLAQVQNYGGELPVGGFYTVKIKAIGSSWYYSDGTLGGREFVVDAYDYNFIYDYKRFK